MTKKAKITRVTTKQLTNETFFRFMTENGQYYATYRLTDLPTYRLTDLPTYRLTDLPTCRLTDLPTYRLHRLCCNGEKKN
jgi:hypothetical protein